jgi:hypothetical protein
MLEKLNASFMNDGKDGIVAEMSTIAGITDSYRNFSMEQKIDGR